MKKHYRGKRHTYARRSVRIGRDKKRIKKLNNNIRVLAHFVNNTFPKIVSNVGNSLNILVGTINRFANSAEFKRATTKYREEHGHKI